MRDGRLTGRELASFGRHMSACRACAHEAKAVDELVEALRPDARLDDPADEIGVARARTRLLADFDRALLAGGRRGARRWLLWSAAATTIACGVFFLSLSRPLSLSRRRAVAPLATGANVVIRPDVDTVWSRQTEGVAERIVLERGALAVHVEHTISRRGRLVVVLPDGELEDIGTTFTVSAADGHTNRVVVKEGSVLLRLLGRAPIALSAGQTWSSDAAPTVPSEKLAPPADAKTDRGHRETVRGPLTRVHEPPAPNEPAQSKEFQALVRLFERGDECEAAAGFAQFSASYPDDPHAEDSAYLRVLALQRCGSGDDTKRAALEYLGRYPSAFRRAEIERLSH
jgi:hypothetical protein